MKKITVSFIIIAFNEEKYITKVFSDLLEQDYPHNLIEVILVDGMSTDSTKSLMEDFKEKNLNKFQSIYVYDNKNRTLPCGWNVALNHVNNDVVLKVDAHAHIPKDFISNNVNCLNNGEDICGGYRPNIIEDTNNWNDMLLKAETSMFGSSIASYRRNINKQYVKSVFHGAYRKKVFDDVGGFNENLSRTEDNEIHYRMRLKGYKICFDPKIISYQLTRSTLKKMIQQKFANGYWIGRTFWVCPKCLEKYHFIPMLFVLGILITSILYFCGQPLLGNLMWGSYLIVSIFITISNFIKNKFNIYYFFLPGVFFLLHVSYGIGTIKGLLLNREQKN